MIESALLWYQLYVKILMDMGFILNPYDPCVANKIIDNKQCTIAWYVDDNIVTHKDPTVVESIIQKIEQEFPGLSVTRGNKHTFLGMELTFRDDGKLGVNLTSYINETLSAFPEDLGRVVASPAAKWLFETVPNARKLSPERADTFHSTVAKLLWVAQRGRVDILTSISFLCTRVQCPDIEDWKKLKRVLKFLEQTLHDTRLIGADCLTKMQSFVDSSHAVHHDMHGHTGRAITFGTGILSPSASKQKMNSRSTNETEVIGNSEYLPKMIWHEYFFESQGYKLSENVLFQDNEGAEKMAKNGRLSCGSRSRHINIKFFWVSDRVKQGRIHVQHCHTDNMLADFFTKPLQGSKFKLLRSFVMGWIHISELIGSNPSISTSEERVENKENHTPVGLGNADVVEARSWADVAKTKPAHPSKQHEEKQIKYIKRNDLQ